MSSFEFGTENSASAFCYSCFGFLVTYGLFLLLLLLMLLPGHNEFHDFVSSTPWIVILGSIIFVCLALFEVGWLLTAPENHFPQIHFLDHCHPLAVLVASCILAVSSAVAYGSYWPLVAECDLGPDICSTEWAVVLGCGSFVLAGGEIVLLLVGTCFASFMDAVIDTNKCIMIISGVTACVLTLIAFLQTLPEQYYVAIWTGSIAAVFGVVSCQGFSRGWSWVFLLQIRAVGWPVMVIFVLLAPKSEDREQSGSGSSARAARPTRTVTRTRSSWNPLNYHFGRHGATVSETRDSSGNLLSTTRNVTTHDWFGRPVVTRTTTPACSA